jgi:hypothetical protein
MLSCLLTVHESGRFQTCFPLKIFLCISCFLYSNLIASCRGILNIYSPSQCQKSADGRTDMTIVKCVMFHFVKRTRRKGKTIPVTGRGGPWGCETSRLPHFLDNQFAYGGDVASLMRQPPFTTRKIPGSHFC